MTGLKLGQRYRIQFFMGVEEGFHAQPYNKLPGTGIAAIEITGYDRVWVQINSDGAYRALDFIAKAATTQVKFLSWYVFGGPEGRSWRRSSHAQEPESLPSYPKGATSLFRAGPTLGTAAGWVGPLAP